MVAELMVIVVGVMIALAADRWNQARSDLATEAAYLVRFVEEISADSARADEYLQSGPAILAGLDSLIAFVDGGPAVPNVVETVLSVSDELRLLPAVAWTEIQASNSLDVIRDAELREALTAYYGARERWLLQWSRQDSRARNPLWDELYRTGVFDPNEEWRSPPSLDPDVLREWPGMRQLLLGVGSGHYFQRNIADQVIAGAHAALDDVRARSR